MQFIHLPSCTAAASFAPQELDWFWQMVTDMDDDQRRQLLCFWTSMSTVPAGASDLHFGLCTPVVNGAACKQHMLDAHKTVQTPARGATLKQTTNWCCRWVPRAVQQVEAADILPRSTHFPHVLLPAQHALVLISAGDDSCFHQSNAGVKGLWFWLDSVCV